MPSYESLVRRVPAQYRYFYGEDEIIPYLLNLELSTQIRDSFYARHAEVKYESFSFFNEFSFYNLYQYLNKKELLNEEQYLKIIKEYVSIFKIIKTKDRITEGDFLQKYSYATRSTWVVEKAYRFQKDIAQANHKILALKK